MRDEQGLAKRISEIKRQIEELKTAQAVGKNQIVIKESTESITLTSFGDEYDQMALAECTITASDMVGDNVLIVHCVPEVTYNGTPIEGGMDYNSTWVIRLLESDTGNDQVCKYYLRVEHRSLDSPTLNVENYDVTFHVWSACNVNIEVQQDE